MVAADAIIVSAPQELWKLGIIYLKKAQDMEHRGVTASNFFEFRQHLFISLLCGFSGFEGLIIQFTKKNYAFGKILQDDIYPVLKLKSDDPERQHVEEFKKLRNDIIHYKGGIAEARVLLSNIVQGMNATCNLMNLLRMQSKAFPHFDVL